MSHPVVTPFITEFTIPSGGSLSDAQHIGDTIPMAIALPTIDQAKITFQASSTGEIGSFYDVYDASNNEVQELSTTGDLYLDLPAALRGANYLKIRSGTSGSPVTQSADRVIHIVSK